MQIKLNPAAAKQLRTVDERLMSYNVEMTEVTGGTFWMAYTPGQVAGTEAVPPLTSMADLGKLQTWYDPGCFNPGLRENRRRYPQDCG